MKKDLSILKKKLSTYKSDGGRIKNVDDELLLEILYAWEEWEGSAKSFYITIGSTYKQMGPIMGRAKKLKREGGNTDFKPLGIIETLPTKKKSSSTPIILNLGKDRIIKFYNMDHLIEFLHRHKELKPQIEEEKKIA